MFSGIVEETGKVLKAEKRGGITFTVSARPEFVSSLKEGDSVAVNGVCQTVTQKHASSFSFFTSAETLSITNLKRLRVQDMVNLERALKADGRFDGHIVSGHIDGEAYVRNVQAHEETQTIGFTLDKELLRYVVKKGSICVNGISLTVFDVFADGFSVVVIPFTQGHSSIGAVSVGDYVNVEVDIIAKYVERLIGKNESRDERLAELLGTLE